MMLAPARNVNVHRCRVGRYCSCGENTLRPGGHVAVEFMVRFWLYVSHLRAVPLRISQPRAAAEGRHNPLIFSLMSGW